MFRTLEQGICSFLETTGQDPCFQGHTTQIQKFVTERMEGGTTADTAEAMDAEPTLDSQWFKDLILENIQKKQNQSETP